MDPLWNILNEWRSRSWWKWNESLCFKMNCTAYCCVQLNYKYERHPTCMPYLNKRLHIMTNMSLRSPTLVTHEATQKRQTNKTGNLALKMSKVVNLLSHFRKRSCETFSAIDLWRLSQHCGARNPGLAGEDPSATAHLKLNLSPFSPCHNQYHVATVMMLLLNKNFHWIKSQGRKSLCRTIAKKT